MALTDAWLKANHGKSRSKTDQKSDINGLGVRVSPKGKITYQVRYRFNGKAERIDIGTYPAKSLREARGKADDIKTDIAKGHDPKVIKHLEKMDIRIGIYA